MYKKVNTVKTQNINGTNITSQVSAINDAAVLRTPITSYIFLIEHKITKIETRKTTNKVIVIALYPSLIFYSFATVCPLAVAT